MHSISCSIDARSTVASVPGTSRPGSEHLDLVFRHSRSAGSWCATAKPEQRPRDVADLDLLRALGDPVAAVVAVDVLEGLVAGVADAAVDLDRAVGGVADEPGGAVVAHRDAVARPRRAVLVHVGGRGAHQAAQQLALGLQL